MPELAEVEFYRKQWDPGLGDRIVSVRLRGEKRIFLGANPRRIAAALPGACILSSRTHGKQMLFRLSDEVWLGLHLGMTGKLHVQPADFPPGKHDHFVLGQRQRSLVFTDPRLFGRVLFHQGADAPKWWSNLPPELTSPGFTIEWMGRFLHRHRKAPIKGVILMQAGFPGIGNWMADEILWRAGISPVTHAGKLKDDATRALWQSIRFVCEFAMKTIARDFRDPPRGWLFNERWGGQGRCPKHCTPLKRATVGGRTTAWCAKCQR